MRISFNKISLALCAMFLCLLATSCQSQKYQYETVANDPLNAKIYTLPNGLKVYMTVDKDQPRIQTYIAVRTGGKNDPHETTGLAHYLEHLMFKGTTSFGTQNYEAEKPMLDSITALYEVYRTKTDEAERKAIYHQIDSISYEASKIAIPNEYDKMMAMIGSNGSNAYTSEDVTCYQEDIPSNQIENWAKVQSDRFKDPVFRLFHTELEAVYEEKNMSMARDQEKVYEALMAMLFPNHPYGQQTVIGTQEHLKNPSLVNIKAYFDKWYVPNNVAICLSGDFDPDNMVDIITKYFGDWKPNDNLVVPTFPAEKPITSPEEKTVLGLESEYVMIGWRFPGAADKQSETLQLAGQVLSNGTAGLMDLDLNQAQKVLGCYAGAELMTDYSMLYIQVVPLPGQTLDEARNLALQEVAKLRNGEFDDELLPSVKTEYKLELQRQLERNESRANMFVQSFVHGTSWSDEVEAISRIDSISKEDIVKFANEFITDSNYVYVNKVQAPDPNIKRIDKPAITPVESNRDAASEFLLSIKNSTPAPIEPVFVDYDKDIQKYDTESGAQLLYRKNETNQLFELSYIYEMGSCADRLLPYASEYLDYIGTSDMTSEDLQKAFYSLGCKYSIGCDNERMQVRLSGLSENMPKAMALLDKVLNDCQPNDEIFANFISSVKKSRADNKTEQRANFSKLVEYVMYGAQRIKDLTLTDADLNALKAAELTDRLHNLKTFKHRVLYYGPSDAESVVKVVNENHTTTAPLADVPANKKYPLQETPENVVYLAPYVANNLYMTQTSNLDSIYSPAIEPGRDMYNEYFGGSMNAIVFQEMRETRGLAYSARANLLNLGKIGEPYYFNTMIATQNDKLPEALKHFNEIIEDMPQSQSAFDNAKSALESRLRTERTTGSRILWSYINAQDGGLTEDPNKTVFDKIQNWTMQDLLDFQQKMIKGRKYSICVLADKSQIDLSCLEAMGPIKEVKTDDIFGY